MRDIIDPDMRLAIDLFPADQVQIIPTGISGIPDEHLPASWGNRKGIPAALRRKHSRIRARYRRCVEAGMNIKEISEVTGKAENTVYQSLRRMHLKIKPSSS